MEHEEEEGAAADGGLVGVASPFAGGVDGLAFGGLYGVVDEVDGDHCHGESHDVSFGDGKGCPTYKSRGLASDRHKIFDS